MSKKMGQFQLIGTIIGHPEFADVARGDILTLEVGDDGKPTSELLRSRTIPMGRLVSGLDEAAGEAAEILAAAREEAGKLIEAAKSEATIIVGTAQAEAAEIVAKAKGPK